MNNKRIILSSYSKGSFGYIFKDSQLNVYKFTTISESGLLNISNINELIIFNKLRIVKKLVANKKLDKDTEKNNLYNLTLCDTFSYNSVIDENVFIQSYSINYYNYDTLDLNFEFNDEAMKYKYRGLLDCRYDKYTLVSKLPSYASNLSIFIEKYSTFTITNFDIIAKKLLKSLAILHHNGILHGDLKSSNVLISDLNNICLTDFGGIKIVDFDVYHLSCTISSRCPEDLHYEYDKKQVFKNTNYKSDIWSLGLIFTEMILGYNPILKMYQKFSKTEKIISVEQRISAYYKTIEYIDILELSKMNELIKPLLNEDLLKKIAIIEKMLITDHTKRLSTIEEVYENLFNEKFEYDFALTYEYGYLKYNSDNNFNLLYKIRQKFYSKAINVCDDLHILYICPTMIDIMDRLLIIIIKKLNNKIIDLKEENMKIILGSVITLVSGFLNQKHPTYHQVLRSFGIEWNMINIGYLNKNLLDILELLDYDIYRPFNVFYCPYYFENYKCNCLDKKNIKKSDKNNTCVNNSYIIHNSEEKNKFEKILKYVVNENMMGISPEYYHTELINKVNL